MSGLLEPRAIGASLPRIDAVAKATGTAPYAYEQPVTYPLYLHPVQASIARGRVTDRHRRSRGPHRRGRPAHPSQRPPARV
jgi:xanthine dehydrogenase YagR molybdenum-binding subunit